MAKSSEAADFERRNTDPTIPIDGADPENIAGPYSNVELEIGDRKRAAATQDADDESTRLRPAFARQKAESGDAITDSDVLVNPAAEFEVGEDNGADARREAAEARQQTGAGDARRQTPQGRSSTPPTKSTGSAK